MYYIKSDRLQVELLTPEEAAVLTTRFDHSSFVSEIILDGKTRLCASEPRNLKSPSSGGRGLCCEIKMDVSGEVDVGGLFPKPGVGLLKKPDDLPYKFSRKYECEPYGHHVEAEADRITILTDPRECLGYASRIKRTFAVRDNELTATVELENTGSRDLSFTEYCHNFMSLDGQSLGPDYSLELRGVSGLAECIRNGRDGGKIFSSEGDRVSFCCRPEGASKFDVPGTCLPDAPQFEWVLSHSSTQISVECRECYRPAAVPVWVDDHMMCPEAEYHCVLRPGERSVWKRVWKFEQTEREA